MNDLLFPVIEIVKKELKTWFYSYQGWLILIVISLLNGLLGWYSMSKEIESTKSLQAILYFLSGTSMVFSVLISMRLFAEEHALGTFELLITTPINEMQIILAKFFAAFIFTCVFYLFSLPIFIANFIVGNPHWGHIVSGYFGLLLLSSSCIAITLFYSTFTNSQLLAAILAGFNIVVLLLFGYLSPYISLPMKEIIREFSLYVHYRDFEKGVIILKHILFFVSVIILYLQLSNISLRFRSWR